MSETTRSLVLALGGSSAVAAAVGCKPSNVRMWISNGAIPSKHHTALVQFARHLRIDGVDHFALSSLRDIPESRTSQARDNVKKVGARKPETASGRVTSRR